MHLNTLNLRSLEVVSCKFRTEKATVLKGEKGQVCFFKGEKKGKHHTFCFISCRLQVNLSNAIPLAKLLYLAFLLEIALFTLQEVRPAFSLGHNLTGRPSNITQVPAWQLDGARCTITTVVARVTLGHVDSTQ